jgi:hypothetical protein
MLNVNGVKCFTIDEATWITPIMAADLLSRNECVKSLKKDDINRIANDMTENEYEWNGSSIILDSNMNLIDGQTRLMACIKSGVSFPCFIVFGVDAIGARTVDVGRPRNVIQWLTKKGYKHSGVLANTAKIIRIMDNDDTGAKFYMPLSRLLTSTDIVKVIDDHPELVNSVKIVQGCRRHIPLRNSIAVLTALDYVTRYLENRPDVADAFLGILSGTLPSKTDNIVAILRNKIVFDMANKSFTMNRYYEGKLLVKAYNLHKMNKTTKKLSVDEDEVITLWLYPSEDLV